MALGGYRPGAGRPKGKKNSSTLEKEAVQRKVNELILRSALPLARAQIGLGIGSQYLYKIEKERIIGPKGGISYKKKKPELVTNTYEIENFLEHGSTGDPDDDDSGDATYFFITTKDPENQAIDSAFNRALGKPKETVAVAVVFSLQELVEEADRKAIERND